MNKKNKEFCLVSYCNIYYLPYAKTYIDVIKQAGARCTLLYWDRDAEEGSNDQYEGCVKKVYKKKIDAKTSKIELTKGYIGATRFIRNELKRGKYDGVLFLQSHAAVSCVHLLNKKYKSRYIVDIRDYSLEKYKLYRLFERICICNSYSPVISSPAYKKFLPKQEYIVAHNYTPFPKESIGEIREAKRDNKEKPINISFVGTVRFLDINKKLLQLFANDKRFRLNYYGNGSDELQRYCKKMRIDNASFYGSFPPEMTSDFYKCTDIINNIYGNHDPFLDYALSNKLYHAGQFHLPILVCPDTFMEYISAKYNMGYVFDISKKSSVDQLYNWYWTFDRHKLSIGCDSFIKRVENDNKKYYSMIERFINGER